MTTKTLINSSLRNIEQISIREFRLAVFICIVMATFNALFVAYRVGYLDGRVSCGYPCVSGHQDFSRDFMRLKIEIALLTVVIALWFRRVLGFFVSLFATLFAELQYALWYLDTRRWLREMGITNFSELPAPSEFPHLAGLLGARLWDLVLLLFITVLLFWQVRVLVSLVKRARPEQNLRGI